jgi:hypothetical protein
VPRFWLEDYASRREIMARQIIFEQRCAWYRDWGDRVSFSILFDIGTCRGAGTFARTTAICDDRHRDWWGSRYRSSA